MVQVPERRLALALAALLFVFGQVACGRTDASSGPKAGPGEGIVTAGSLEDVFLLTGELKAVRSDDIAVPRTENVQVQITWLADDGADVAEGDRVVEFEATSAQATLEERRAKQRQAEIERETRERALEAEREQKHAAVDKAKVEADKARIDAAVPKELRSSLEWTKMQAALHEKDAAFEKARLELDAFRVSSRADLDALVAAEEKARRARETAEEAIQAITVHARRSGIFLVSQHFRGNEDRKFQAGDNAFQGMTVATIPDPTEMEVAATLSQVDHGQVDASMKARIVLDTWPDRVFEGRVEEVGAVAPEGRFRSVGFPVRVSLTHTDPSVMRPGLSVRVDVVRGVWPKTLLVPRSAVRFDGDKAMVVRSGRSGSAEVRLAGCSPVTCAVEAGLAEGDRVRLF